jgi:hypothetical protein
VIVDYLEFSKQLLQRVVIFLLVMRTLIANLLINFMQQRMKFKIEMLKPLKDVSLLMPISSLELLSGQVVENGVGLIDGSLGCDKYKPFVFFVDLLGIDLLIGEEECNLYLFEVGIIVFGEV